MVAEKPGITRVVLDTNVIVSALLFGGALDFLVSGWTRRRIVPVFSKATFDEFARVLTYPKFSLTNSEIALLIEEEVLPYFDVVDVHEEISGVCRDPGDDRFLSCAVSANADFIISGDRDLLDLVAFRGIPVVRVEEFRTGMDK